jgi:hypothetical protein
MLYELRVYHIHPGKMQEIKARFRDYTLGIFAKHGMKVIAFWENTDEARNSLYYVMEHQNLESRNQSFEDFNKDPDWIELKRATEQNGPLIKEKEIVFLKTVPFFERR